jgi:hypothetical protein
VAASQIEANERVQDATEAARSAVIQAESTTVAAQAQVQIAAAETHQVKVQCEVVAARVAEAEKNAEIARQTAEQRVAMVKQHAEATVNAQQSQIYQEAGEAVQIERNKTIAAQARTRQRNNRDKYRQWRSSLLTSLARSIAIEKKRTRREK